MVLHTSCKGRWGTGSPGSVLHSVLPAQPCEPVDGKEVQGIPGVTALPERVWNQGTKLLSDGVPHEATGTGKGTVGRAPAGRPSSGTPKDVPVPGGAGPEHVAGTGGGTAETKDGYCYQVDAMVRSGES